MSPIGSCARTVGPQPVILFWEVVEPFSFSFFSFFVDMGLSWQRSGYRVIWPRLMGSLSPGLLITDV